MTATQPRSWWQWVLVYPTLALALIQGVPGWFQWIQSRQLGVPQAEVTAAVEQHALWGKNLDCTHDVAPIAVRPEQSDDGRVEITVCPSGDILVKIVKLGLSRPAYRWIALTRLVAQQDARAFAPPSVFGPAPVEAGEIPASEVLCQRVLPDGRILRRVRYPVSGQCYDEVVNPYSGVAETRQPAPCTPRC
jgi:hypothetical protein